MAKTTPRQRKTTGRIMHEFAHGELKSGRGGKGGKVKSRRQAIAIALKEAGASRYESGRENARNRKKYERKEAEGKTFQQEQEGKSHVGARGRRELGAAECFHRSSVGLPSVSRPSDDVNCSWASEVPRRRRINRLGAAERAQLAPMGHR
jgi:hypothetical protein